MALSLVLTACAGVGAGMAWALFKASQQPPSDLERALQELRAERAKDKAELAELAERMVDAGERVSRARARIETANQRAEERQKREAAPDGDDEQLPPLEAVKLRARRLGKL